MYTAEILASLFPGGSHELVDHQAAIEHVCIDSRKAAWQPNALFIAMQGARTDGHKYILDAWSAGVRNFLVHHSTDIASLPVANYIKVDNVIDGFQKIAAFHRSNYKGTVIAVTGSNGKTWVKEWLYMLLYKDRQIYRSPGSYNSQVGVPLSVFNIPRDSSYAIIEAGVSEPGEMTRLETIIQPDIVIFTHLGDAHDEGFDSDHQLKLNEKLILCRRARMIIFPADESLVARTIANSFPTIEQHSWSTKDKGSLQARIVPSNLSSTVHATFQGKTFAYDIPFTGAVAINNSLACLTTILAIGIPAGPLLGGFRELQPIDMRLKAEDAIQQCVLINDSYSLDLDSLQYALESLDIAGQTRTKTLILSDHAHDRPGLYQDLAKMITGASIDKLICIGNEIRSLIPLVDDKIHCMAYQDVDDLIRKGGLASLYDEVILLKGARKFGFERIARQLRLRSHSAVLHVDFTALDHNLRYFYKKLNEGVKKIAVVKANAYGAGSLEVCRFLSWQRVDMLAVAVIDEGVELREAGISMPVIVLNPDPEGMDLILQHNLEPEIYNLHVFNKLLDQCKYAQSHAVIHIKIDSGTHRLGFGSNDIPQLISIMRGQPWIKAGSIFTHLSGSDDPKWDDFTHEQVRRFGIMYDELVAGLGYRPLRHILSTSGVLRFPEYQFDAIRLGIGLYGVGMKVPHELLPVHSLKARILHIHRIGPGESVSYSRSFITDIPRTIATVNIGYADGLPRVAGEAGCAFRLHGKLAPILGRVCMDMTMVDVTHIPEALIGDEIVIFDQEHSIEHISSACGTIPYEILTHLNPRIRKVYEHG